MTDAEIDDRIVTPDVYFGIPVRNATSLTLGSTQDRLGTHRGW
ncbi:MAG TPA: hypothetical protein VIL44_07230 [Micromonospora sp.]